MKSTGNDFVDGLSAMAVRQLLADILAQLDECDLDDELGTEGWRHRFSMSKRVPRDDD